MEPLCGLSVLHSNRDIIEEVFAFLKTPEQLSRRARSGWPDSNEDASAFDQRAPTK
jgi:hypothetical protein